VISGESEIPEPIAVVGLGCRMPMAPSIDALWDLLDRGVCAITEVPADRWPIDQLFDPSSGARGKMSSRHGAFVEDVDLFDAAFFGVSSREAREMDPQQRLLLEVAWQALERGGIAPHSLSETRTGVYVGIGGSDYAHRGLLREGHLELINPYTGTGNAHSIAANRLSYFLGLQGPSLAVDTACSSSLVAIHLACVGLRGRETDVALAGGVNVLLSPEVSIAFSHAHMLAADGRCKTFDVSADGYVRGEGCGLVVLKRLTDARRDGNRVFAVIRGTAVNQDGRSNGLTAPNGLAQQAVIRTALAAASVLPSDIGYVEAHGTGTPLGDPIEVRALCAELSKGRAEDDVCVIGSIKTNIGHLETASGVAGLFKAILALEHERIPAHLHLRELNPKLGLREPMFTIPRETRLWPRGVRPRLAAVSSYGFGGTNACVVVEEASVVVAPRAVGSQSHLLCLSARTAPSLQRLASQVASALERPNVDAHAVCFTAAVGRDHFAAHRLSVTGRSGAALRDGLRAIGEGREIPGASKRAASGDRRSVAFLFSGQGTQFSGMGSELYAALPAYRTALEDVARLADPLIGRSLLSLMFDAEQHNQLDETRFAQPALFAVGYALFATWTAWGVHPVALIGHSLGELIAATAAGVLSLEDAIALVCERARLMQEMPPGGGMLAITVREERVAELLGDLPSLSVASVNGPEDVVVSGDRTELQALLRRLEQARIAATPLNVSHAFHSRRMEPLLGPFESHAERLSYRRPTIPLVSNVTGRFFAEDEAPSAGYFARHIRSTVRFADGLASLAEMSCAAVLEIGPSATLTALGRRSQQGAPDAYVPSLRGQDQLAALEEATGALYVRGVDLDWKQYYAGRPSIPVVLPTYSFDRERFWLEDGAARTSGVQRGRAHALLGQRLSSAIPTFESSLDLEAFPWLRDHRIGGVPVMPAAGYLCLSLRAAAELDAEKGHALILSGATFVRPLVVEADKNPVLQLVARPDGIGGTAISIHARRDAPAADWSLHASATVGSAPSRGRTALQGELPWAEALRRCPTPVAASDLYDRLAAAGLEYGPCFRGIAEAWIGDGMAVGRLVAPSELVESLHIRWCHPAMLDSAFQLLAAAAPSGMSGTFVPTRVKSLRLEPDGALDGDLWVVAKVDVEATSSQHLEGDLVIYDRNGRELAGVTGLATDRIEARPEARPDAPHGPSLYEVCWEALVPVGTVPTGPASRGDWIVLIDEGGLAERIAQRLEGRGARIVRVKDVKSEALAQVFGARAAGVAGILDCRSLDATRAPDDLEGALSTGPISLLQLVQAIAQTTWDKTPRLFVVTASAVSVSREPLTPTRATLWGFGRTLAREHPELSCTLFDLPERPGEREIDSLLAWLLDGSNERQVALREGASFVPRLRSRRSPEGPQMSAGALPKGPLRLHCERPGSLASIALKPAKRRMPGSEEVEIAVSAAGLNFRDVMKALGMYPTVPGDTSWYGDECAGVITAVGQETTALSVGDRVVAMTPAAFSDFVTAPAAFTARIPPGLSDADAAGLLVAFTTAHHGLVDLARLQKGEGVLIHGGAGGVGMAAIQVALDCGAKVFATAGTPERRKALLELGVSHAFDSRSLAFAEQILEITARRGVDVVLNSLSGEALHKSLSLLAPLGRFVEIGKRAIYQNDKLDLLPFMRNLSFFSVDIERLFRERPEQGAALIRRVMGRVVEGRYRPLPVTEYPLGEARDAFRHMAQSHHVGKIVLRFSSRDDAKPEASRFRSDATYLITGGTGALGSAVARSMAAQGARQLVLCSRRLPDGPAADRLKDLLEELRGAGVKVRLEQLDVSEAGPVGSLVRRLHQATLPLRGIVHAAGVIDDGLILRQTAERCLAVLQPKVAGSWNLHQATKALPLDFFITFSSVASVLGSPGQASYAAGNAFLDALAQERRRLGLPVLNVNWGPWGEAGMAARTTRATALQLLQPIVPSEGIDMLWRLLDERSHAGAVVLDVDWWKFFQAQPALREDPMLREMAECAGNQARPAETPSPLLQEIRRAKADERASKLELAIRARLATILGTAGANVSTREPLSNLGVDSLMAVELQAQLENELRISIPRILLIQSPTITEVALRLVELVGASERG
jgi:acyl transferase domain-containing protein/NADPH-dependent curcumin reductase CurA/short-subunit dehydrogenase/acyl carrier protein